MTDKLGLGCEIRELKLGSSFTNSKSSSYHTIKYDFKPASVDVNKMATVDAGTNNQVTVTVPHLDGAGVPCTVFKGNQRPYTKECVLIIDKVTGQITLEKLSSNMQVKKTRQESSHRNNIPAQTSHNTSNSTSSSNVPSALLDIGDCTQRSTSRTRVASGTIKRNLPSATNGSGGYSSGNSKADHRQINSASRTPPSAMLRSPPRHKTSPPQSAPWLANAGNSTLASLPLIGFDDPPSIIQESAIDVHESSNIFNGNHINNNTSPFPQSDPSSQVGVLSSSSGSSSDSGSASGSGSDSDHSNSDSEGPHTQPAFNNKQNNGVLNGKPAAPPVPMHLLTDDLCLSESESDSD